MVCRGSRSVYEHLEVVVVEVWSWFGWWIWSWTELDGVGGQTGRQTEEERHREEKRKKQNKLIFC